MTTKRKQRVAPPAGPDHWEVRCGNNDAGKGWDELCQQAPGNTRRTWEQLSIAPEPAVETPRQHRLRGSLAVGTFEGREYPRWQIEVTGGGRIWYLVDVPRRTVWIVLTGNAHPKATE